MGYLFELHCHTKDHSFDGKLDAAEFLRELIHCGYNGATLTDHNYVWPDDELADLRQRAELPEDFFLASGQEIRVSEAGILIGDLLAFGIDESLPNGTDIKEVMERCRTGNGFCLAAHPGAASGGLGEKIGDYPIAGAEVWNGRYGSKVARRSKALARDFSVPFFGGSDSHVASDIATGGTMLPRMPKDLEELGRLIKNDEAKPWKPMSAWLR